MFTKMAAHRSPFHSKVKNPQYISTVQIISSYQLHVQYSMYNGKTTTRSPSVSLHTTQAWCIDYSPANQAEPWEAVIEGVTTRHHVVTFFNCSTGHLCCSVIHFPHQIQSLSADVTLTYSQKILSNVYIQLLYKNLWPKNGASMASL